MLASSPRASVTSSGVVSAGSTMNMAAVSRRASSAEQCTVTAPSQAPVICTQPVTVRPPAGLGWPGWRGIRGDSTREAHTRSVISVSSGSKSKVSSKSHSVAGSPVAPRPFQREAFEPVVDVHGGLGRPQEEVAVGGEQAFDAPDDPPLGVDVEVDEDVAKE